MHCPNNHGEMLLENNKQDINFRNESFSIHVEQYRCPTCGFEGGSLEQISKLQNLLSDAYRKKAGLLTVEEIIQMRKGLGLSQKQFSDEIGVGVASIKRWETGTVQTKSMDNSIRLYFNNKTQYNGNREFSLSRIKLVILTLESFLKKHLCYNDNKFLFTSKYLWYADMLSFRGTGKSMTGATYAALPMGPQLNNYKELVPSIKQSDVDKAEKLLSEELDILKNIAKVFPNKWDVYRASHNEIIWKDTQTGCTISYTESKYINAL